MLFSFELGIAHVGSFPVHGQNSVTRTSLALFHLIASSFFLMNYVLLRSAFNSLSKFSSMCSKVSIRPLIFFIAIDFPTMEVGGKTRTYYKTCNEHNSVGSFLGYQHPPPSIIFVNSSSLITRAPMDSAFLLLLL